MVLEEENARQSELLVQFGGGLVVERHGFNSVRRIQRPMVKALLCDIDGTLVQSNWLHAAAWRDAFAEMGMQLELEDLRRQIGKGGDQLIPVFVPWWKRRHIEDPLQELRKFLFESQYREQVKPIPRVREFLLHLRERGIRLALASSASKKDLTMYKKIAHMEDLIEEESSADDADRSKPHPDIFVASLKRLGLAPADVLALGDTPYDAEAAGKAGVWTIGVTTGGWSREDLLAAGCVEVYQDVGELLDRFEESALVR
jgi:HAD superfamily hydrolase (TIGR01509 family)